MITKGMNERELISEMEKSRERVHAWVDHNVRKVREAIDRKGVWFSTLPYGRKDKCDLMFMIQRVEKDYLNINVVCWSDHDDGRYYYSYIDMVLYGYVEKPAIFVIPPHFMSRFRERNKLEHNGIELLKDVIYDLFAYSSGCFDALLTQYEQLDEGEERTNGNVLFFKMSCGVAIIENIGNTYILKTYLDNETFAKGWDNEKKEKLDIISEPNLGDDLKNIRSEIIKDAGMISKMEHNYVMLSKFLDKCK